MKNEHIKPILLVWQFFKNDFFVFKKLMELIIPDETYEEYNRTT